MVRMRGFSNDAKGGGFNMDDGRNPRFYTQIPFRENETRTTKGGVDLGILKLVSEKYFSRERCQVQ
jgi:hypothetical protein